MSHVKTGVDEESLNPITDGEFEMQSEAKADIQAQQDADSSERVREHVFDTYLSLRGGMGWLAALFPVVVVLVGFVDLGFFEIEDSLSAYYWASKSGFNVARIPFVGGLWALGAFLYLYKGFTTWENGALNVAAGCAIGVACFPMAWTCDGCSGFTPHGLFAFGLFGSLVYVVWYRSADTLAFLPSGHSPKSFAEGYAVCAFLMLISPVVAAVLNWSLHGTWLVILVETFGVWAFAGYWFLKTKELKLSQVTRKALALDLSAPIEKQKSIGHVLMKGVPQIEKERGTPGQPALQRVGD